MRDLLRQLGAPRDVAALPRATLAAPTTLGGPDRLTAEPEPLDWQTLTLWGVLIAGVGVVGFFAIRLVRD